MMVGRMMNPMHLALHGLALKRHANAEEIANIVGLDTSEVQNLISKALDGGRVVESNGKYMLSPLGQIILSNEYSRYYLDLRDTESFVAPYERFEILNLKLKKVITDWQTIPIGEERVANDHTDPDYDEEIISRLCDVHDALETILKSLSQYIPRLSIYLDKLEYALDKAESGEHEWVSDAKVDSYHTVWFELHEDLLRIMGRQRQE